MTKKWDDHKAAILDLYKERDMLLREVRQLMAGQYGSEASYTCRPSSHHSSVVDSRPRG